MFGTYISQVARVMARILRGSNTRGSFSARRVFQARLEVLETRALPSTLITSVPYTIDAPGTYDLASNLYYKAISGNAITVRAENVIIDLQGHTINSSTGASTTAIGIAAVQESYVTIQNGTIQGFQFGINLTGKTQTGNEVQNMVLDGNWYFGLWVEGANSIVQNNQITNTGGCNIPGYTIPIAMHVAGANVTVANNTVSDMIWCERVTQEVVGLALDAAPNATVNGNTFSLATYTSHSYAIWVDSTDSNYSTTVNVENNSFTDFQFGSFFASSYGQMMNNQYVNVATLWVVPPSNAGTDQGGNTSTFTDLSLASPTLLSPSGTTPTLPEFSWTAVVGADNYNIWITDTHGGATTQEMNVTGTTWVPTSPLVQGDTYNWWVQPVDAAGQTGNWSYYMSFTVAELAAPSLNVAATTNGSVSASSTLPTFSWSPVAGADHYDIWVQEATGAVLRDQNVSGTTWTPTAELPSGLTTWWVRAVDSNNSPGPWSASQSFYAYAYAAPTLVGPTGTTALTSPIFSWNAVAGADHYDIWIDDTTTGQPMAFRDQDVQGTTWAPPVPLNAGDTYYWWVRAVTSDNNAGAWSGWLQLSVLS